MESLGNILAKTTAGIEALPSEAQCPVCEYFDLSHPDVARILYARDPKGWLYQTAGCKCLQAKKYEEATIAQRIQQANLPNRPGGARTISNFEVVPGTQEMVTMCHKFGQGEGPPLFVIVGGKGVGKTHMLEAICREYLSRGISARYERSEDWLVRLRYSYDDDAVNEDGSKGFKNLWDWYRRFAVFCLDDVGLEKATEWATEKITACVDDASLRQRRLVITTNNSREEMVEHMGERLASRIYGINRDLGEVEQISVVAGDYRNRR